MSLWLHRSWAQQSWCHWDTLTISRLYTPSAEGWNKHHDHRLNSFNITYQCWRETSIWSCLVLNNSVYRCFICYWTYWIECRLSRALRSGSMFWTNLPWEVGSEIMPEGVLFKYAIPWFWFQKWSKYIIISYACSRIYIILYLYFTSHIILPNYQQRVSRLGTPWKKFHTNCNLHFQRCCFFSRLHVCLAPWITYVVMLGQTISKIHWHLL